MEPPRKGRPRNNTHLTDEQALLISDNYLLILKCMNKYLYIYPFLTKEAVWDCCIDAAINSARLFDERKGKFSTLYYRAVKSDIYRLTKKYNAEINDYNALCSLDKLNTSDSNMYNILGREDKYSLIDRDLIKRMIVDVTEKERIYMYQHFVIGKSKTDISKDYAVTPQAVYQTIINAIKKIKNSEVYQEIKTAERVERDAKTS